VLILGNSDRDWTTFDHRLPSSVRKVLLQNSFLPNDGLLHGIPIGLENRPHGRNGMPHLFLKQYEMNRKSNKIMVGPFGATHPLRTYMTEADYSKHARIVHYQLRMSCVETALISSTFQFVAAPRGNGRDTHRFWEVLYRGSLPVVHDDTWTDNMQLIGVPLVRTNGWSADALTSSIESESLPFSSSTVGPLWLEYWRKLIEDSL